MNVLAVTRKVPERRIITQRESTVNMAGRLLWTLLLCEAVLLVLDYHLNLSRGVEAGALRRLFDMADEGSLASWFHGGQTLLAATVLWLVGRIERIRDPLHARSWPWTAAACLLLIWSVEGATKVFATALDHSGRLGEPGPSIFLNTFASITLVILASVGLVVGLLLVLNLTSLTERMVLLAGGLMLGGAETFQAMDGLSAHWFSQWSGHPAILAWSMNAGISGAEAVNGFAAAGLQGLHMLGVSLLLFVFVKRLEDSINALWSTSRAGAIASGRSHASHTPPPSPEEKRWNASGPRSA